MMARRSEVVATYWDGSLALVSACFMAGSSPVMPSATTECRSGELLDTGTTEEAKAAALANANYWAEKDAEDEEAAFDTE